jgi:hypothetical protein
MALHPSAESTREMRNSGWKPLLPDRRDYLADRPIFPLQPARF